LINTLEPIGKIISTKTIKEDKSNSSSFSRKPYFTTIPDIRKLARGINSASDITSIAMDKSCILHRLIQKEYSGDEYLILGEMQFAFLCFLLGQSYEGFIQWKAIVHLLCTSESALNSLPALYSNFITALYYQLKQAPDDFFLDPLSENNFLSYDLRYLFESLLDTTLNEQLLNKGNKFRKLVEKRFGFSFTAIDQLDSNNEDAPIIVEQ